MDIEENKTLGDRSDTIKKYTEILKSKFIPNSKIESIGISKIFKGSQERFDQLKHKQWDWWSFYNGWAEGRMSFYSMIKD